MTVRPLSTAMTLLLGLVLAVGTLQATPSTGSVGGRALTPVASACADVAFVAAGGDGQASATSAGPALQRLLAVTRAAAPDRTFTSVSVPWSTTRATTLRGRGGLATPASRAVTTTSVARWAGDVRGYAARLGSRLAQLAADCPRQSLVLAGHAQGALALHRVLTTLPTGPAAVQQRVVGAALVSDGYRLRGSAHLGAPAVRRASSGVLGGRGAPVSVPVAASRYPVVSVCTSGDLVCDLGTTRVRRALAAHASYGTSGATSLLGTAAGRLARGVARTVLAAPLPDVRAIVGVPVRQTVPLRVLAEDRDDVVLSATGTPPGTTLDRNGLLSGAPTTAGTWTVEWTATNAAAPWTLPATGRFRVVVTEPRTRPDARVSAGGQHSCALDAPGRLRCWGANDRGQLGTGSTGAAQSSPVAVAGDTTWSQVSAGGSSTCAIRTDRSLWCWGLNHEGQLGDGTRTDRAAPVRVTTTNDWASVSADWWTTCATRTDGRAYCWGQNTAGQVGDGSTTTRLRPTAVLGTGWRSVETAGWHSCGVRVDGTAACWGRNNFGELGTGGKVNTARPTAVPGTGWRELALSWGSTCGTRTSGAVQCWGRNDQGQVGDGTTTHRVNPQTVVLPPARTVVVGDTHACALDTDGGTWCWGSGDHGNLGVGTTARSTRPVRVTASASVALDAGWAHTCSQTDAGTTRCWGDNAAAQLGDGTTDDSAGRGLPAARAASTFTIATFNQLGHNHTLPGAADDVFAPAWIRAQWSVQTWRDRDLSVVGGQEADLGQIQALQRAAGAEYAAWPGTELGRTRTHTSVWWRTSDWEAVERTTFEIPFMTFTRTIPVVRLRSRVDPARTIWVMNVHNAPGTAGQGQRDRALKIEVAKVRELVASGDPVFLVGDFNEQTAYCKVAPATGLTSPRGGSVSGTTCTPPSGNLPIDWIFGRGTWSGYTKTRDPLVARITDHHLTSSRVTLR
ncbi:hypothetical protein ASG49_11350 [Marmoricola sp. Leaf446]|uniref:RCC1 domain-containing protein n=1 Tax=Marmoricola sp. Leaf446 TaxID=1736379 RepID=UPI0006F60B53|nr:cutinase family protein [Marmoricola sp. Leaf446]KQT91595.1 hypothetical protein ASG49_11350 [Marmoricola sp. Leaf446]